MKGFIQKSRIYSSYCLVTIVCLLWCCKAAAADDCVTIPYRTITIDGNFDDWSGVVPVLTDMSGDVFEDAYNDMVSVSVAHDDSYLYVKVELKDSLDDIARVDISPHFGFYDSEHHSTFIAAFFPGDGPNYGWENVVFDGISVMTYPAGFLRYSGKNIEFKALLKDIPNLYDMKTITAWVLGADGLTDHGEDVEVCGLEWPAGTEKDDGIGFDASTIEKPVVPTECMSIPFKRITVDGDVRDWGDLYPMFTDLEGDVYQNASLDFKRAYLANDGTYLYGRFEMGRALGPNSSLGANLIFSSDKAEELILGAFFSAGPYNGFADITYNKQSIMNYPSEFLRYSGNNLEFKFLLKDIPALDEWNVVSAWTIGAERLYDTSYDIPLCGFLNEADRSDLTGWWYDPSKPGTGLSIEFNDENRFFLAWYVYDRDGMPVWYTADGALVNKTTFTGDLKRWSGWHWGSNYEPPVYRSIGSVKGVISDSDGPAITLNWSSSELGDGTLELINFLQDLKGGTADSRGLTGWWYDPSYVGMGFFIEVREQTMFMAWYNYREGGVPIWWTSTGPFPVDAEGYHGTFSLWQGGQVPGGRYEQPRETGGQGSVDLVFVSPTRARLTFNGSVTLELERFDF